MAKKGQLTKTISDDAPLTPASRWQVAGKSVAKVDGAAFVTGRHEYASDIRRPGMLFGKVLRPESLHAKLVSVDFAKAQALPGVTVVHDGDFVGVAAPTSVHDLPWRRSPAITAKWNAETRVSDSRLFEDLKKADDDEESRVGLRRAIELLPWQDHGGA